VGKGCGAWVFVPEPLYRSLSRGKVRILVEVWRLGSLFGNHPRIAVRTTGGGALAHPHPCTRVNERGVVLPAPVRCGHGQVKTVKREGVLSLYNGFVPNFLRIGPWCAIMFTSYEQYRMFAKKHWAAQ
jgi:hypothetical protein